MKLYNINAEKIYITFVIFISEFIDRNHETILQNFSTVRTCGSSIVRRVQRCSERDGIQCAFKWMREA